MSLCVSVYLSACQSPSRPNSWKLQLAKHWDINKLLEESTSTVIKILDNASCFLPHHHKKPISPADDRSKTSCPGFKQSSLQIDFMKQIKNTRWRNTQSFFVDTKQELAVWDLRRRRRRGPQQGGSSSCSWEQQREVSFFLSFFLFAYNETVELKTVWRGREPLTEMF